MAETDIDELTLLGAALYAAQRVEYLLYGLAAHAAQHAVEFRNEFKSLTPDTFLEGDGSQLKATFGKLVRAFGEPLLIRTPDLLQFCKDRNLIVHNYVRVFRFGGRVPRRTDGLDFLRDFVRRALEWEHVLRGLLYELRQAAAVKEGRVDEIGPLTEEEELAVEAFHAHVARVIESTDASS